MLSQTHAHCIAACRECITACESWLDQVPAPSLRADVEQCAELCRSSARLCRLVIEELTLGSAFSLQTCALGTVICRACATECAAGVGRAWEACAAACRRAAEECHAVATMTSATT